MILKCNWKYIYNSQYVSNLSNVKKLIHNYNFVALCECTTFIQLIVVIFGWHN